MMTFLDNAPKTLDSAPKSNLQEFASELECFRMCVRDFMSKLLEWACDLEEDEEEDLANNTFKTYKALQSVAKSVADRLIKLEIMVEESDKW